MGNSSYSKNKPAQFYYIAPLILWSFMTFWLTFLTFLLYASSGEGKEPMPELAYYLIPLFYLFGISATIYAYSMPLIKVSVFQGRIKVKEIFPFRINRFDFRKGEFELSPVKEDKDSDGDIYYSVTIRKKEKEFVLIHKMDKEKVEETRERFLKALGE